MSLGRRITGIALLGLVALLVAALLARKPLVELATVAWLAAQGVSPVTLRVSRLDLEGVELTAIEIGRPDAPHVAVQRIVVRFDGLAVATVDVHGLRVVAAIHDGQLDSGPVMVLAGDSGAPADTTGAFTLPTDLPDISLHGASLLLRREPDTLSLEVGGTFELVAGYLRGSGPLELGSSAGSGVGQIELALAPDLTGSASLSARDVLLRSATLAQPLPVPVLDLVFGRQSDLISADIVADIGDGEIAASLLVAAPFDRPTIDLGLQVALPDLTSVLPLLSGFVDDLPVQGGSVTASLALGATAAADITVPDIDGLIRTAVGEVRLTGEITVPTIVAAKGGGTGTGPVAVSLAADGAFRNEELKLTFGQFDATLDTVPDLPSLRALSIPHGPGLVVRATPNLQVIASRAVPAVLTVSGGLTARSGPLSLSADFASLAVSQQGMEVKGADLSLAGLAVAGQQVDHLRFRGDAHVAESVSLSGRISADASELVRDGSAAAAVSAALDIRLTARSADDLALAVSGRIMADDADVADQALGLDGPVINLDAVTFTQAPGKGMALKGSLVAAARGVTHAATGEGAVTFKPVSVTFDVGGQTFETLNGTLALRSEGAMAPGLGSVGPIRIAARSGPTSRSLTAQIAVDGMRPAGGPGLQLPAMDFAGVLDAGTDQVGLEGKLIAGLVSVDVSGAFDPSRGSGQGQVVLPVTALPVLSELLRDTILPTGTTLPEGRVSVALNLFHDGETTSSLALKLEDAGVATAEVALSGINADLYLDSLQPPRTAMTQEVRIATLAGPTTMRDLRLRFDLAQTDNETVARVSHLSGLVLGGEMELLPFDLRVDETRRRVDVALRGIDMAEVVTLAGLEGFILTGSLSGTLPVEIVGDSGVAVRQGRLVADGPGRLQIDGARLRGLLGQQGGEELDLMIRTLEDFRYDLLEISLDKALEGDAKMLVTLGGMNPAVLEGYPFRFNISVAGDADRLLATILTVYRASSGMIEQGIKSLQ